MHSRRVSKSLITPALALCVTAVACDLPPSLTVVPGCDISEETQIYGSYDASESYVFVIDPEVRRMGPEHVARIEASLLEFMQMRLEGRLWIEPHYPIPLAPTVVRVAVILVDGTPVETFLRAPPSLPGDGEAFIDGGLEVWTEDDAWKAWFAEGFASRIHEALAHEGSTGSTPRKAATRFADAHPYFDRAQVVVVTSRDDESEAVVANAGRFPWFVVVGAIPEQPSRDGSAPPFHGDIQAQLDLHSGGESPLQCEDGTPVGDLPQATLRWSMNRQNTSLFSLCDFDLRDASIPRLASCLSAPPNSVAHVYAAHPDGTVDCSMNVLLPASGPRRHCSDFGFEQLGAESEEPFERERCSVPQLTDAEVGTRPGFHSLVTPDAFRQQQLIVSSALLPTGTESEIRCWRGNDACGFNGNFVDAGARLDAR